MPALIRRLHAGVGNYLEALSVRQELIAAEQQLASLQTRRVGAWATLNEALGGGFKPATDAPSLATAPQPEFETKAHR